MSNKNIVEYLLDETERNDYPQERQDKIRAYKIARAEIFTPSDKGDDMRSEPSKHHDHETANPENKLKQRSETGFLFLLCL